MSQQNDGQLDLNKEFLIISAYVPFWCKVAVSADKGFYFCLHF